MHHMSEENWTKITQSYFESQKLHPLLLQAVRQLINEGEIDDTIVLTSICPWSNQICES